MIQEKASGNTVRFDREFFEAQLPANKVTGEKLWKRFVKDGEYCYAVKLSTLEELDNVRIIVRSSIRDGQIFCDDTGNNSIRVFLLYRRKDGSQIYSSKLTRWITRSKNWKENLYEQFSILRKLVLAAGTCKKCGQLVPVRKSKKTGNFYAKCFECETWGGNLNSLQENE